MKAREVLMDCKECYWDLKEALEKNDQQQIRIKWITCLTFLRMVGHVCDKVDKANYSEKAQIFDQIFEERKNDFLFKSFIDNERNMAIKEYQIMITPDKHKVKTDSGILFQDGSRMLFQSGEYAVYNKTRTVYQYSSKKSEGDIKKRLDIRIDNAIKWWENYLNDLEERLNAT